MNEIRQKILAVMQEYAQQGKRFTVSKECHRFGIETTAGLLYHVRWLKDNGYVVQKGKFYRVPASDFRQHTKDAIACLQRIQNPPAKVRKAITALEESLT